MKAALLLLTVTAYSAADHPPVGATGHPVLSGMTGAVSRDLEHLMHTWVDVGGKAVWINDRMNKRYRQRLDVALDSIAECRAWGRRRVKVEIAKGE